MEYRWLEAEEIENIVNPICRSRGWAELNINMQQPTCRVLGAFDGGICVGFLALQLFPVLGPAFADAYNRQGIVSRELADRMHAYLEEVNCRGALTICEEKTSERLAERHGMQRIEDPVYMWVGPPVN